MRWGLVSVVGIVSCLVGCRFDETGVEHSDASSPQVDAALLDGNPDSSTPAADAGPPAVGTHLLLTEVKGQGTEDEFIEIYNPTGSPVSLEDYYLSDHSDYALTPGQFGGPSPQIGTPFDFIAHFPANSVIAPRGVVVIAVSGTKFQNSFGFQADYALDDVGGSEAMIHLIDSASPAITDTGEMVVLYYWDGQSDLIKDVDITIAGNAPSEVNSLESKTGVLVDGPDGDLSGSQYADDGFTIGDIDADTGAGLSYKRIALEGAAEAMTGSGNGITGDDETTEDLSMTWDDGASFTAPTPGEVPASINP